MVKIKTALIGTGFMGKVHAEAIRRLGNVEIAAVASIDEETARKFADSIGVERATGDYRTILADPSIQAVHVVTPNALHYPVCKEGLEAGKNVLCEKPFTVSVAEARELVDLAAKTGLANCLERNSAIIPWFSRSGR